MEEQTNIGMTEISGELIEDKEDILSKIRIMDQLDEKINNPNFLHSVTLDELYKIEFDPQLPIIEGLLCPGTYVLAAAPKIGKSFLAAQIAYSVATGNEFWGLKVNKSEVLYCALEDTFESLQKRYFRMFDINATNNLHLVTKIGSLGEGFENQINNFLNKNPKVRLVIIDTLQKIRNNSDKKSGYSEDYKDISQITTIANERCICFLLIHHTRKQASDDKFDKISGTNGILGSVDNAIILEKDNRLSNEAQLTITGRNHQDAIFHLTRNNETLQWMLSHIETDLWEDPVDPLLDKINELVLENNGLWTGSATDLTNLINTELSPAKLSTRLNIQSSKLLKDYSIRFEKKRTHDSRIIVLSKESINNKQIGT